MANDLENCLWHQPSQVALECLEGTQHADIAIIGGGLSGLWTAWHLQQLKPELNICVLEAEHCGFGASGRNGGWLMGSLEGLPTLMATASPEQQLAVLTQLRHLVPDVAAALESADIDCDFHHGGGIFAAARFPSQLQLAKDYLNSQYRLGFDNSDYCWLDVRALSQRVRLATPLGGIFTPHVATIHPGKLIAGLTRALSQCGVRIFENSSVIDLRASRVKTIEGEIVADQVVLATEGYSVLESPPISRYFLPVTSGIIATEPLSPAVWQRIGLEDREALSDFSRLVTYAQRTADDRLVFGARGSLDWRQRAQQRYRPPARDTKQRCQIATELLPDLGSIQFSHSWQGSLSVPRSGHPTVTLDQKNRVALLGGYTGEGVGASFLLARSLAEHLTGLGVSEVTPPWLKYGSLDTHVSRWEPWPLPWLGFQSCRLVFEAEELAARRHWPKPIRQLLTLLSQQFDRLV